MFLFAACLSVTPARAMSNPSAEMELGDNPDFNKVVIAVSGSVLHVTGAENLTLSIYNIAGGQPVMRTKIESNDKSIELNLPKGIYIVQVGNKATRKIVIR